MASIDTKALQQDQQTLLESETRNYGAGAGAGAPGAPGAPSAPGAPGVPGGPGTGSGTGTGTGTAAGASAGAGPGGGLFWLHPIRSAVAPDRSNVLINFVFMRIPLYVFDPAQTERCSRRPQNNAQARLKL